MNTTDFDTQRAAETWNAFVLDPGDLIAQPNVSAILNGHRSISRTLAKALAQRFNVSVEVFL